MTEWIHIKGARQNNLKNLNVSIPKNRLVVITGPSGAGKSSLAFDTLYAEGQRRYVESLSASARQFLNQLEKPDVDAIEGLAPAIAIEQRGGPANPRSTVGTTTEIYDYLRLLFARVGHPFCHRCGQAIRGHSVQQIVDQALVRPEKSRLLVCAPVEIPPHLDFREAVRQFQREGFVRIRMGEEVVLLDEGLPDRPPAGTPIQLVVDRLSVGGDNQQRLTEAVELALDHGGGLVLLVFLPDAGGEGAEAITLSRSPSCTDCDITYPEPHPRNFSFNSPFGACQICHGLGRTQSVSESLVVPDPAKTLAEGAIAPWERKNSASFHQMLEQVASHFGFSIFTPFKKLSPDHQAIILQGTEEELEFSYEGEGSAYRYQRAFEGVIANLERRFRETESASVREEIRRYMTDETCGACKGNRLRQESLHYKINGLSISEITALDLDSAQHWADTLELSSEEQQIAAPLLSEIRARLGFLRNVGLQYLSLNRSMDSLSSGEGQRIRLATQIGSALAGVIYILDEPTIGLHQRDTRRLLDTLIALRESGNTVVVVEHDRDTLEEADYLIEIGPEAGEAGGRLVAEGPPETFLNNEASRTAQYLNGKISIPVPKTRREGSWQKLRLTGASGHNLKNIDVVIPLGLFTCVTGVSGSGKSTLVLDTLLPGIIRQLNRKPLSGQPYEKLEGVEYIDRVIHIDQSPIGRSSRSNPGTYLSVFNQIRELFASVPESRARGYQARRFSFNVEGGRCEGCQGEGYKRIEMHFLPDVFVKCDICEGSRYNRETMEIRYRGKRIDEVLNFTVTETEQFFRAIPGIRARLQPMLSVGLGYLKLGQAANTLSGGEAQRLKIVRELGRRETGRTLYLLDEPTTGLHFEEVEKLVAVLNQLVDSGNSVVVIEHNLELIKCADHIIDLGPEAGENGGNLIAQGKPEQIIEMTDVSSTAKYLEPYLDGKKREKKPREGRKERDLHSGMVS